jgi:Tfp pilus assembly protein PilF
VIRAILRQNRIDSIRYILSTRESSLLNEGQAKNAVFEAESWALTHFLILGPNMGNGQQMTKLLNLLQKHISGIDAFQQIFGDPDKLDGVLDRYIGNPQLGVFVYKPTRNVDASTFSAGAMTPAETDAELGGAYVRLHQSDSAITRLKAAISEDPQSALAHENLAILDFDQGKDDDAQQEFDRAVALNPKSYLAIYYEAMLAYNGKTDGDSLNKLDAALRNVLQLNPSFAPAVVVRSRISAQQQKLQDAVDLAEQSQKLEPDRAGYATNLAAILMLGHDYKDAAKIAEATAARWSGSDSAEALAVLKAARTEGNIAATPEEEQDELKEMKYAEGMLETAGVIKSITCVPSKPIEVVLQVSDRLLTFRTAKGSGFGFSDTIWYGEDHFSVCHHLEGMRAVIRYMPPQNANDPVEFKWAEIRDQLVPSSPPLPTN